jgi:hypothetical protein
VAPRQHATAPVAYPEGATGAATIALELVIGVDGHVEEARLLPGESGAIPGENDPFAAAALEAARGWTFDPATRDGLPIRATIRAKVVFDAPPEPVAAEVPKPEAPKQAERPIVASGDDVQEIEVLGTRPEVGQTTIRGGEVRIMPGAFGDPFRAIEALPGVTPLFSGLPFFYVRGAPPGNTGYFIDGVRVPMLFHLGAGPSVLSPALIDRVDFFPAGYPARFGRFSGGIVAGETGDPAPQARGEGQLRLFDVSGAVETPFASGRGDAFVAGRYGYPGLVLSLLSSEVDLQYWDYQVRTGYRVSERDRISIFGFGAFDRLDDQKNGTTLFDAQFHRIDLRWDRVWSTGLLRLATTLMADRTGLGDDDPDDRFAVQMLGIGARLELEERLSKIATFRGGADLWLERYRLLLRSAGSDLQNFLPTRTDLSTGVRGEFVLRPTSAVEIVPGLRADLYTQGSATVPAFEPRLSTRIALGRGVHSLTTLGVAHQTPSFIVPAPGVRIAGLDRGLQQAFQFAQGVEVALPAKFRVTATGFLNQFRNLNDPLSICAGDVGDREGACDDLDARVRGRTFGLELLLKRALTERLAGFVAYTLSRSNRMIPGATVPSQFDRTHVLSVIGSAILGRGWRFGARFSYLTGRPYRYTVRDGRIPGIGEDPNRPILYSFAGRLPDFHRLDLRLEKRWVWSETRSVAFVIELFNGLFKKEATEVRYCSPTGACEFEEVGPVSIPSIGLEGSF